MQTVSKIAVVGTGQMGMGIAITAASRGLTVALIKASPGTLEKATNSLYVATTGQVAKEKMSLDVSMKINKNITLHNNNFEVLKECDLVIESVLEEMSVKLGVLPKLEAHMRDDAIVATNTSSLRLDYLAKVLQRPEKFVGLHFFNPVQKMKLVELSTFTYTPHGIRETCLSFCETLGKHAIPVETTPGYVVNRLLMGYLLHSIDTLEQGIAGVTEVDTCMKLGCGHPMGPLALADYVGLDVVVAIAQALYTELNDRRYRVPSVLRRLVSEGHLGKKTGKGFYDYSDISNTLPNPDLFPEV